MRRTRLESISGWLSSWRRMLLGWPQMAAKDDARMLSDWTKGMSDAMRSESADSTFSRRQLVAEWCKFMCLDVYLRWSSNQASSEEHSESEPQFDQESTRRAQRTRDSCKLFDNQITIMSRISEETGANDSKSASNSNQQQQQQQQQNQGRKQTQDQSKQETRQYDLVIFAASGTVGKFLVEELALVIEKHYSSDLRANQPSVATSELNLRELRDPNQFAQQPGNKCATRRASVPRNVDKINWAVAGRSAVRLSDALCRAEISTGVKGLSSRVPVILADLDHHRSLLDMCSKTSLVINCAGPYTTDGEPLIKACLETRTNYIDLSHESNFIERIRVNYHTLARRSKVYILNGCGFQSMSAEMGLNFIKQVVDGQIDELKIMLNLNDTNALVRQTAGRRRVACNRSAAGIITLSMWNSLLLDRSQGKTTQFLASLADNQEQSGSTKKPGEHADRQRYLLRRDTQTLVRDLVEFKNKKASGWLQLIKGFNEGGRRYCLPVNSFTSDESQLTRGQMNNYEIRQPDSQGEGWRPVICTSYLSLRNIYEVLVLFFWMLLFNIFVRSTPLRALMRLAPSIATLGQVTGSSSREYIDRDSLNHIKFCQTFIAYGTPGDNSGDPLEKRERHLKRKQEQLLVARIVGPEPNHVATATFAIQAALAIILERDHLPSDGGVLTPGAAFSETNIIYQLRRRNIKFEVLKKA